MLAAFRMPTAMEQAAEKIPAASSPFWIRSGNCFNTNRTTKKVSTCTTKATAPQIAQSNRDSEWVIALASGIVVGRAKAQRCPTS